MPSSQWYCSFDLIQQEKKKKSFRQTDIRKSSVQISKAYHQIYLGILHFIGFLNASHSTL